MPAVECVLVHQVFSHYLHLFFALGCRFGILHFKVIEGIQNDLGNNQTGILLIICWNDIPGCIVGARGTQALLVSFHVVLPEFSFMNV